MSNKLKRSIFIGMGALALSTLSIQASDVLRGLDTGLTGLVKDAVGPCGDGAQEMFLGSNTLCVDVYETSPGEKCPRQTQTSQVHTQENLNSADCQPATKKDASPWTFVSLTQAQQLCARVGKRLPSNEEWYKIASGLTDVSACVINENGGTTLTGSADCTTPAGIHDMVGNVWEWVDEEVSNGVYNGRGVPETGYVTLVDKNGVVLETGNSPAEEFGSDYAWTKNEGVYGIIRGGFYGSREDAGIFAQNLAVPFDFKTGGVGFRCVRDI